MVFKLNCWSDLPGLGLLSSSTGCQGSYESNENGILQSQDATQANTSVFYHIYMAAKRSRLTPGSRPSGFRFPIRVGCNHIELVKQDSSQCRIVLALTVVDTRSSHKAPTHENHRDPDIDTLENKSSCQCQCQFCLVSYRNQCQDIDNVAHTHLTVVERC